MLTGIPHLGELFSLAAAVLWSVAVILYRKTGQHHSPLALNLFKNVVGLAGFLLTLPLLGIELVPEGMALGSWLILLGSGVLGIGAADTLFFFSLNRLGAGRLAVVECLYSPFVLLVAVFYLDEPVGPALILAMILMGAALLFGAEHSETEPRTSYSRKDLWLGLGAGALSMLLMAVGIVWAKPVLLISDPWWATTVRLVGGIAVLLVFAVQRRHRAEVLSIFRPGPTWKVALPGGLVGAYLALICWIVGMKLAHTGVASVLNQLSSVFTLVLATVLLRERLRPRRVLAIALGFAAGLVVMG